MNNLRVTIAQINPKVGDLEGNYRLAEAAVQTAIRDRARLVVFTELAVTGYPPKDLLTLPEFIDACLKYNRKWAKLSSNGPSILFGSVERTEGVGNPLYNIALLAEGGKIIARQAKTLLPTYDVFDEDRYFRPADHHLCLNMEGFRLGVSVCEDIWNDRSFWKERLYTTDPIEKLMKDNPDVLINISASPFALGKPAVRRKMLKHAAKRYGVPLIYANQVGGNDDVIYDGRSMVLDASGQTGLQFPAFTEAIHTFEIREDGVAVSSGSELTSVKEESESEEIFNALVLGVKDYSRKCGFSKAVLGLSGGIDSAIVAVIAAAALGPQNVFSISMPSRFSSDGSKSDAQRLAAAIGINFGTIPIEPMHAAFLEQLAGPFAGTEEGIAEENLQARIRGTTLMALSNKFGYLLLSTGNKSEVAMGYCTLYGDTNGGLAVISDVFKTKVYKLARWINANVRNVIPEATISKPPSAELKPNQTDQDSLPPYDVLDAILSRYIEEMQDVATIVEETDFDRGLVAKTIRTVFRNEYKRKQLPPGLKITKKAFGTGRQMPLAQGWPCKST